MSRVSFVLLASLLLVPISVTAQADYKTQAATWMFPEHEDWLKCQSDDQCIIIVTHACGFNLAINKNYLDQATQLANKRDNCSVPPFYSKDITPKCINSECVLAYPRDWLKQLNQ